MSSNGVVSKLRGKLACIAAVVALSTALLAAPALAQSDDAPSSSATVNLIRLLVKQGVITQKAGGALLKQAETEAAQARSAEQSKKAGTIVATASAPAAAAPATEPSFEPPPGTVRVPYIPASVKKQITDQVKQDVMAQAKSEGWAQPKALPNWLSHITVFGDFRFRDEFDLYATNNIGSDHASGYINYAAFNSSGPTDVSLPALGDIPILNTTENRLNLFSIRARLGVLANITDGVQVGIRIATGNNNNPVSTTQYLGGGMDKKGIWLDQAYIKLTPWRNVSLTAGRMPNPFMGTDLAYDNNLNFDGVDIAAASKTPGAHGIGVFGTAGAFPIGYIDSNFPDDSVVKTKDHTEWLLGGQAGFDWATDKLDWRLAGEIYDFVNAQGQFSAPCAIYLGQKQCSTDNTVPAFMQKGNTLFLVRNIIPDPSNPNYAQPQFAGLAMNYNEVGATTSFDLQTGSHYHLLLEGEYLRNLAYDPRVVGRLTAENAAVVTNDDSGAFTSGPNAFQVQATFGDPGIVKLWDWNIVGGYKYLDPDSVLDAFTNVDFHLGGTNAKGYFVKASLGVYDHTWLMVRYFSANQISGPNLGIDVLYLEINSEF